MAHSRKCPTCKPFGITGRGCPPEKLGPACRKRTYVKLLYATYCVILEA